MLNYKPPEKHYSSLSIAGDDWMCRIVVPKYLWIMTLIAGLSHSFCCFSGDLVGWLHWVLVVFCGFFSFGFFLCCAVFDLKGTRAQALPLKENVFHIAFLFKRTDGMKYFQ